jgi:hypothetical protein
VVAKRLRDLWGSPASALLSGVLRFQVGGRPKRTVRAVEDVSQQVNCRGEESECSNGKSDGMGRQWESLHQPGGAVILTLLVDQKVPSAKPMLPLAVGFGICYCFRLADSFSPKSAPLNFPYFEYLEISDFPKLKTAHAAQSTGWT